MRSIALGLVLAAVTIAACGDDRPPVANAGSTTPAAAPNVGGGIGGDGTSSGSLAMPPAGEPEVCGEGMMCGQAPLYCESFVYDPDLWLIEAEGVITSPPVICEVDTDVFLSPPSSFMLRTEPDGVVVYHREGVTTIPAGRTMFLGFAFRVDEGGPPPELARFEVGARTYVVRVVGAEIQIAVHASAAPWNAPFTDDPLPFVTVPYRAGEWNQVGFDVHEDADVPLGVVLGSAVIPHVSNVMHFDDVQVSYAGCDAGDGGSAPAPR